MSLRLPLEERWTKAYQSAINGMIERAVNKLNEFALVRAGGSTGQVLAKASARDFDLAWTPAATDGALVLNNGWVPFAAGWADPTAVKSVDGIVHVSAILKNGTITAGTVIGTLPVGMRPLGLVGYFTGFSAGAVIRVFVNASGQILIADAASATNLSIQVSFKAGQ
jgi:hypothetical protein